MKTTPATKFIVRNGRNSATILCTDGNFHARCMVGPGGWCAKLYKTEAGAKKNNPDDVVEPYTAGRLANA